MSNSPIIPKEQLSAYQRWELNSFDPAAPAQPTAAAAAATVAAEKVRNIHQQAYQSGHADGLREGTQKAAADSQQLRALINATRQQSAEINQQLADDLLGLALELARRMVKQALVVKPELILPLVQDALAHISQPAAQATIALHPEDAKVLRERLGEQLTADGWRIVEDPTFVRGGCMLRTSGTQVDATVGARWKHLATALGQDAKWLD
jgi:flagellar assembly protein FliH